MGNTNCGCGCSNREGKENEEVRFTEGKKEKVIEDDIDDDDEFRIRPMEFYLQTKKDIMKVKSKNVIDEEDEVSMEESGETIRNNSDEEEKETESKVNTITNEDNGMSDSKREINENNKNDNIVNESHEQIPNKKESEIIIINDKQPAIINQNLVETPIEYPPIKSSLFDNITRNQNKDTHTESNTIYNNDITTKTINNETESEQTIPISSMQSHKNGPSMTSYPNRNRNKDKIQNSNSLGIGLNPYLEKKIVDLISKTRNKSNQASKHHKNTSSMLTLPSPLDKESIGLKQNKTFTRNPSCSNISSNTSYKGSFLEMSHIQFGIENKDELTFDEKKLLEETQKNLNQFFPPKKSEMKTIDNKLKHIELTSIIPELNTELSEIDDSELLYHGEMKKMINYEINAHKPKMYSERFCTVFKNEFRYYKSKEQFLTKQKPLCVIPLTQIARISFAKWKKSDEGINHIIISNKLGIYNKKKRTVFRMFDSAEKNAFLTLPGSSESLLIFTSNNIDKIYEWYAILNYLLKMNENGNEDN